MVVQWKMTKAFGVSNLVNVFIAISILAPAIVTLSLQYPVGQFIHGPFHFCNGRFEVYFDPTHPGMNFIDKDNCQSNQTVSRDRGLCYKVSILSTKLNELIRVTFLDPVTPGRREDPSYCVLAFSMMLDEDSGFLKKIFYGALFVACRVSVLVFFLNASRYHNSNN